MWRNKYVDEDEETPLNKLSKSARRKKKKDKNSDEEDEEDGNVDDDGEDGEKKETNTGEDGGFLHNVRSFFNHIRDPNIGTGSVDVYAWMFRAQLIVFIIIISCWSSFDPVRSSEVHTNKNIITNIIEGSAVPKTFLGLSLTWFLITIFDRGTILSICFSFQ